MHVCELKTLASDGLTRLHWLLPLVARRPLLLESCETLDSVLCRYYLEK